MALKCLVISSLSKVKKLTLKITKKKIDAKQKCQSNFLLNVSERLKEHCFV